MRAFAYLCALVLLVPQVVIDASFLTADRVTAGGTLRSLIANALDVLSLLLGWGGVAILAVVGLAVIAAFSRWSRGVAAVCAAIAGVCTAVDLLRRVGPPPNVEQWMFFLPALIAVVLCGRIAFLDFTLPPARIA
jgi:prolipoprotein diacylglyceryltransferase